jgi:hypothetical protein
LLFDAAFLRSHSNFNPIEFPQYCLYAFGSNPKKAGLTLSISGGAQRSPLNAVVRRLSQETQ